MPRARTLAAVATIAALLAAAAVPLARADDYSNAAYLQHDLDNLSRSLVSGRQVASLLDPAYAAALTPAASEAFLANLGRQVDDIPQGRIYATLGALLPGGAVGDPLAYYDLAPTTVAFLSRTGAKLVGRMWSDGHPGQHPAVVITPGSIQGTQHMYWWAARTLAHAGYLVLTFDVQGQGESETFGHVAGDPVPTDAGFPFQQASNFVDGTVDALRFLYATTSDPYVPGGWRADQVAAARAAGDASLSWVNPLAGVLDRTRLALAGHSLGASAVSVVQQCAGRSTLWRTLPVCTGRSFPIKAVVGWDGLASSAGVTPVVPGMDQQADGYFLTPQPTSEAPDPAGNLGAFRRWRAAGMDSFTFTVRGGTHLEWVDVPYILPSTTYGVRMADLYTLAWIERYTAPTIARRAAAADVLLAAPRREATVDQLPWRADFMSARHLGAFAFHDAAGHLQQATDLRAYGGASPVGDWSAANADQPVARGT
jgi:hypothetical protein